MHIPNTTWTNVYFISKESEDEQHEGSSDAADSHGESSATAGNFNTAHMCMQYRETGLTRGFHMHEHNGSSYPTFGIYSVLVFLPCVLLVLCVLCACVDNVSRVTYFKKILPMQFLPMQFLPCLRLHLHNLNILN